LLVGAGAIMALAAVPTAKTEAAPKNAITILIGFLLTLNKT
jgi:hypothetical protein